MTAALAASALALPAAAQDLLNPQTYLHGSYVQLDGGSTFQGRTSGFFSGNGVGAYGVAEAHNYNAFGSFIVGHDFTPAIAVELEGVYQRDDLHTGRVDRLFDTDIGGAAERTYGGLANIKLRIPYSLTYRRFSVSPYIAGGIGYGDVQYTTGTGVDADKGGFMYQGKAGLEIKTGTPVSFDLGYRYLEAPQFSASGTLDGAAVSGLVKSHVQAATAGVRYTF